MYYLIGIKGTGMSALAGILKDLGYEVKGSDNDNHYFTEEGLKEKNIEVLSYDPKNIQEGMYIIKGGAIKDDNTEVQRALELGLKIHPYEEMVAKLTTMFQTITIAGCHGKTTTTSMLSHVLDELRGANYLIGDGTGHANKENKYFVLEACEYKRHFLAYHPYYAIITNIDLDHVDYYQDIDDVISAYTEYANNAEKMVIACGDDPYTHSLEVDKPIFYYGLDEDNDIIAKEVEYTENGTSFDVFIEDNYYGHFDLKLFGKHMLLDALAVISFCYYERLEAKEVSKTLKTFEGAKRRFTEYPVLDNIVIDDYAHHPAEIRATLKAVNQKYPDKKTVVVFGPHTYSRTKAFKDDYIDVLSKVDKAYIMDIYGARENQEDFDITSEDLIKEIPNSESISKDQIDKLLGAHNSVIIFMSPNDITDMEKAYIEKYQNQAN
ncbi:MAG TPA: UDP-N-acetylmuramate--L-alanine ligase [Candidatus Coprosoma intestinipullorum]|uniref:UDP-N-acetylmuramate--L-alanine ligase n=1 Tax=Candidatus Coprosoma intestinipullorum TaxID=2840752 RepID=A0A9D0ZPM0_9FIRM|nr:UDP-N-acetylmuramate--L-alanine ligase [Candidatus Coprosoma intestinipullorum]